MEKHGFTVEPNEWWHFNYKDWEQYPILDIPFSAVR
jgi:D-alanyl-D-alanine dipeptidase